MLEISKNGSIENSLGKMDIQERRIMKETSTPEAMQSRTNEDIEPREEDYIEAADFGMKAMNDLYLVKEPKLYSMGIYLDSNNPARYVAAFNEQSEEAKQLAKFGYAALKAAKIIRKKFPDLLRQASVSSGTDKSSLRQQCPRKGIPQCPPASLRYRTADGSCNNFKELWWGSSMSTMQRFLPPVYEDNIESIRRSVTGNFLPSARQVSDYIHHERDIPLASVTLMLMQWGQFIDHDITATGQSRAFNGSVPRCCLNNGAGFQPPEFMHPDCLPIAVHPEDSHLGKLNIRCLEFVRSGPAPREDCEFGAREQLSQVTSFIDASTVYSSSARQSDSLRIFRNGLMQYGKLQSQRPVLPREDSDLCRRGSLSTSCFKAGDGRLSEQPALTSLHVVFLRLHNRLATQLAALNQHWSDEKIFQETRRIVGAIVQHITYREFLPIVLGAEVMRIFDIEPLRKGYYEGYDQSVDPNIANAFSTAAYRFGHSLVQHSFVRFDRNHQPIFNNVTIHDEFTNPANLESAGSVDRILLGLANQPCQRRDEFISSELTNHLFQTPGFPFGMDLAALNIQRGRDHGIPPFVDWRETCSLSPIRDWNDLERIMAPETAKKFQDLYAAVEDIDLFSAGLAEKPVVGGLVGPTFACIIAQQFRSLRKGDRFWYENPFVESGFSLAQLQQIRRVTLAQILCRTMDNIDTIQPFVMLAPDNLRNKRLACDDPIFDQINLDSWIERPSQQRKSSNFNKEMHDNVENEKESDNVERQTESRASVKNRSNQRFPQRQKPVKANINQQNRITIKRPLGPHENLTIVVNNNAVHSPIFVTDSIYGSNVQIHQFPNLGPNYPAQSHYQKPSPSNDELPPPVYRPIIPQRPNDHSSQSSNPYYPYNFEDPSNPNPPSYGLNAKPLNNFFPNNEFFAYNAPSLPSNRPSLDTNFNENQQESYFTTKRPIPTFRPTAKPPLQQHDYNQYQQNYLSSKKPLSTHRPTTKLPFIDYEQDVPGFSTEKPQESYSQNNNRPQGYSYTLQTHKTEPYPNFESNNSNRDEFNSNYYTKPSKKPNQSPSNVPNRRYIDSRPYSNDNIDSGDGYRVKPTIRIPYYGPTEYLTSISGSDNPNYQTQYTSGSYIGETNKWHNLNRPQNQQLHHSSLENFSDNTPVQKPNSHYLNQNLEKEETDHQEPSYLHTHTTISDIQYVLANKPQKHKYKDDLEIPRPLTSLQSRESIDSEIEKRNQKLVPEMNSMVRKEIHLTTKVITDEIELATQTNLEQKFKENTTTSTTTSDDIPVFSNSSGSSNKLMKNETLHTTGVMELPRPMKLRHGN